MSTTPSVQDDLIAKAAAGDRWSLESLLIHFHDPLLHFISHSLLRSPQKSAAQIAPEDILQETMMEAFRSITALQSRGSIAFFAWLKTIARSRFLNMLEAYHAQKRGGHLQQIVNAPAPDITAITILARIAGADPTPSWIARRKETLHAIAGAINSLDEPRRQLIDLRYRQALPIEQIAALLGKSEGAVKMALNRTIKDLQLLLAENLGEYSAGA